MRKGLWTVLRIRRRKSASSTWSLSLTSFKQKRTCPFSLSRYFTEFPTILLITLFNCSGYRADASRNSRKGGTGLGLAIAKKIIEEHCGEIWAVSDEGIGIPAPQSPFHLLLLKSCSFWSPFWNVPAIQKPESCLYKRRTFPENLGYGINRRYCNSNCAY